MNEREVLREIVKDFLKPIVAEVIEEVLAEMANKKEKRYYTRAEACEHLKIGTTTFYRLAGKGKIKLLKIEGKTLVDADELDEAIQTRMVYRYQHG